MSNIKKNAVVLVVGALAGVGGLIKKALSYNKDVKVKRGQEYSAPEKDNYKYYGDEGEKLLEAKLLAKYKDVFLNKFVDNKNQEIDAILVENGHIILIEMKNWKGSIYGDDNCKKFRKEKGYIGEGGYDDTDVKDYSNPLKKLRYKANILKYTLGSDLHIDTLLVFGNESILDGVNTKLSNVCNIADINNVINNIISKNNKAISDEIIKKINDLVGWDILKTQASTDIECIVMDKTLEFRLYPEFENEDKIEIIVTDIDNIEIKARKTFRKNKPDDVIVYFKDGTKQKYLNFSGKISIFNGLKNENEKISISKLKYIKFSKTRSI